MNTTKFDRGIPNFPDEVLLTLGTLVAAQRVAGLFAEPEEQHFADGVIAGIVVTLHEVLPPCQFIAVMAAWEIDGIKLSEILRLIEGDNTIEA